MYKKTNLAESSPPQLMYNGSYVMADELDLDLETTEDENINNRRDNRLKDLSEKVKLTAHERDELAKAKEQAEEKAAAALKEVDFFKNFTPLSAKYQGAAEFQDKIKEKVMAGYDVEDATISTLAKEGRLTTAPEAPTPKENPAGGSAPNTLKATAEKPLGEMTRDEKRQQIIDAESRGEISLS